MFPGRGGAAFYEQEAWAGPFRSACFWRVLHPGTTLNKWTLFSPTAKAHSEPCWAALETPTEATVTDGVGEGLPA